jgi:hypothetical protein
MAYAPFDAGMQIGEFREKDFNNFFEYGMNPDLEQDFCPNLPHIVWVGGIQGTQQYRYAYVRKTVAYVAIDENDDGTPLIEKWHIKGRKEYSEYI